MNKSELITAVAESADVSKAIASKCVDAVVENIITALAEDEVVTLIGFGTFSTHERSARTGRNPRTGESIKIKAKTVPAFKPSKALKDAVNK